MRHGKRPVTVGLNRLGRSSSGGRRGPLAETAATDRKAAVALCSSLDGHPGAGAGAVAETSEPESAAGRALKSQDGVGLSRSSLLKAVRARTRLGMVRVEGVR